MDGPRGPPGPTVDMSLGTYLENVAEVWPADFGLELRALEEIVALNFDPIFGHLLLQFLY